MKSYHVILPRDLACPQCEAVGVPVAKLMADGCNMVDQAQLLGIVALRVGRRADIQAGHWENARLLPMINDSLDLWAPHQIRRAVRTCILNWDVVVRASNLVLGTVLALREILITPDVPLLARLATLARLGVAKGDSQHRQDCHRTGPLEPTFVGEDHHRDQPLLQILRFGMGEAKEKTLVVKRVRG